jgi:hypothetical protein
LQYYARIFEILRLETTVFIVARCVYIFLLLEEIQNESVADFSVFLDTVIDIDLFICCGVCCKCLERIVLRRIMLKQCYYEFHVNFKICLPFL